MATVVMSAIPGEIELLRGTGISTVAAGIGKVNAASVATEVMMRPEVDTLIFTGVAGGLDPSRSIGDIVVGECTIQHDAGTHMPDGFEVHQAGHLPFFNPTDDLGFRPPAQLLDDAVEVARSTELVEVLGRTPEVVVGTIVTGDQFIDDPKVRKRLHAEFDATAVEMEGAAVAQVAARLGVECVVIRAISDLAGGDAQLDFTRFVAQAAENSAAISMALVERIATRTA